MRIKTEYLYPPIPDRRFDWCAYDDDTYDGAPDTKAPYNLLGFGRTEAEAIADLKSLFEDYGVDE